MSTIKQTAEQLIELAKVLNEFKSEAVQIRLLELLFDQKIMEPVSKTEPTTIHPVEKPQEAPAQEAPAKAKPVKKAEPQKDEPKAEAAPEAPAPAKQEKKSRAKKAIKKVAEKPVKKRSTTRPGPSVILKQLVDNKFFADSRNIGDVVDYCKKMYKYEYKSTDLSGTLAKYSKEGILNRTKNPETNQFEYTQPQ
jgi:outer membrane biosynthesis protein TonB